MSIEVMSMEDLRQFQKLKDQSVEIGKKFEEVRQKRVDLSSKLSSKDTPTQIVASILSQINVVDLVNVDCSNKGIYVTLRHDHDLDDLSEINELALDNFGPVTTRDVHDPIDKVDIRSVCNDITLRFNKSNTDISAIAVSVLEFCGRHNIEVNRRDNQERAYMVYKSLSNKIAE